MSDDLSAEEAATRNSGHGSSFRRVATVILLVAAITAAICWYQFGGGRKLLPHDRARFTTWVRKHPLKAPLVYISVYVLLVLSGISPVWPLQALAGSGFGIVMGIVWSQAAATIGSAGAMLISRFIAADWFHRRVEARMQKLKTIDEKMGHNGLLVVMAVRLMHFIPVGISNYVFGLTTISVRDVIVGTLIGGVPATSVWVGIGAGRKDTAYFAWMIAVNVILLSPLAIRYWKPQWFRKIGIE